MGWTPKDVHIVTLYSNIVIGSSAIILNSILLLVLYFDPFKKFRTPGTVLVANLALSDALTGLFITLRMVFFLIGAFDEAHLLIFFIYSTLNTVQVSLLTVLFITLERLFAVAFPIRFKLQVTKMRTFLLSLGGWAFSITLLNVCLFVIDKDNFFTPVTFLTSAGLNFFIICLIIIGYCGVYKLLKRKEQDMGRYGAPCGTPACHKASIKRKQNSLTENKKLINTFRVITIILLITVLPMMILTSVAAACSPECATRALQFYFKYEPISLINFNVNPVIYAFQLPTYRKAFLTVFRCRKPSNAVHPGLEVIELR